MVVDVELKQRCRAQVALAVSDHIALRCGAVVALTPKVGFIRRL